MLKYINKFKEGVGFMKIIKLFLLLGITSFTTSALAEYYYSCSDFGPPVVEIFGYPHHYHPVKKSHKKYKHHYVKKSPRYVSPKMEVYYIWNVVTPVCGCDNCACRTAWVASCDGCRGGYAPAPWQVRDDSVFYGDVYYSGNDNYRYYDPDLSTGDDNAMVNPEMNIDN